MIQLRACDIHIVLFHKTKKGGNFTMIVYQEFSSLVHDLGFSGKTLYSVTNHIHRHYRAVTVPKRDGETRELHVPDALLMAIQRRIHTVLLSSEPISRYATAYRLGGSTRRNASPHAGKAVVLKLDIRHFFDRLIYPLVKERAFPATRYSEQNRVLLSLLCIYRDVLPQGAPTSPTISNIIMHEFDVFTALGSQLIKLTAEVRKTVASAIVAHRGVGMDRADDQLILGEAAVCGKSISYGVEKLAAGRNQVAGNVDHAVIAAFHGERGNGNGGFNLTRDSFVKLTDEINAASFGNDADLTPTELDLIHGGSPLYTFLC
jgi:hypothetical protein